MTPGMIERTSNNKVWLTNAENFLEVLQTEASDLGVHPRERFAAWRKSRAEEIKMRGDLDLLFELADRPHDPIDARVRLMLKHAMRLRSDIDTQAAYGGNSNFGRF